MILFLSEICRLILGFLEDENFTKTYQVFLDECAHLQECRSYIENGLQFSKKIHGKDLRQFLTTNSEIKEYISTNSQTVKKFTIDSSCQTQPISCINSTEQTEPEQKKIKPKPSDLFKKRKTGCFKHKTQTTTTTQSPKTAPIKQSDDLDMDFFIENLCQNDFAKRLAESINEINAKKTMDCSLNETSEPVIEQMEIGIIQQNVVSENDAAINFNLTQLDFDDKFFIGNEDISLLAEHFSEPAFEALFELISSNESKLSNNLMQQPTEPIIYTENDLNIQQVNNLKETGSLNCNDSNKQIENEADFASNYYPSEQYSYENNEVNSTNSTQLKQKEIEPETKYEKELDSKDVKMNILEKSSSDLEQDNSPKEERNDFVPVYKDPTIATTELLLNENSPYNCVYRPLNDFDYNIQEIVYKTVSELNKSLETDDNVPDEISSKVNDQIDLTKVELEESSSDLEQDNSQKDERQQDHVGTYYPTERYCYDKNELVNGKDFMLDIVYKTVGELNKSQEISDIIQDEISSKENDQINLAKDELEESSSDHEQENSAKDERKKDYAATHYQPERYYDDKNELHYGKDSILETDQITSSNKQETESNDNQIKPETDEKELDSKVEKKKGLEESSSDLEQENSPKDEKKKDYVATYYPTERYYYDKMVNGEDFMLDIVYKTVGELNKSQETAGIVPYVISSKENDQIDLAKDELEESSSDHEQENSPYNCVYRPLNDFDYNFQEIVYKNVLVTDKITSELNKSQDAANIVSDLEDNEEYSNNSDQQQKEVRFYIGTDETQYSPVKSKLTEGKNCIDSNEEIEYKPDFVPCYCPTYNNSKPETDSNNDQIKPETDRIEPDKDENALVLENESNSNQKCKETALNESPKEHIHVKEPACLQTNQNLSLNQTEDHEVTIDISSPLKEEEPEKYINEVKRYEQPVCSINGQSFIIIGKYPEVLSFEKKLKSIIKATNDSNQTQPIVSLDQEEISNSALNTSSSNSYSIPPTPFLKQSQQTNEDDLLSDYSDPDLNLSTNAMPYSPQPPKTPPKPIQSYENSQSCSKKIFKKSVSFQCSFKDCFPSNTKTDLPESKPIETIKEEEKLEPGEIEDDSNEVEQINKENNITSTPTKIKQEEILSLSLSYSSTSSVQTTPIKALNSSDNNNKPNIKETNEKTKNKSNELNIDEILKLVKPTSFITNEPSRKEPTFKKDYTKQSTESILRQSSSSIVFRPDSSKSKENRSYNKDYKDRRDYKSSNRKSESSKSNDYKRKRDHDDFVKDDYESGNKKQYNDSKRSDRSKYDRYTSDTSYNNNKRFNSDRNSKYSEWK